MKRFVASLVRFLSRPIVPVCVGLLLMIVPPCIAACKGLVSLEPGFTYGVFYGVGLYLCSDHIFDLFNNKSRSRS